MPLKFLFCEVYPNEIRIIVGLRLVALNVTIQFSKT